ncbi:hypothetical protein vBAspALolek_19 [Aeromonas phage vB_AspA_Lolek]|nr:hypothetical protein vBAspALolek_19 [Aeromonas phage vB_AspA_Lolek]
MEEYEATLFYDYGGYLVEIKLPIKAWSIQDAMVCLISMYPTASSRHVE